MSNAAKYFFTIGVPVYNAQNTIKEAIESALNQATSYPYEIIIIDDGSNDKSSVICKTYSSKHKNLSYFKTTNQGPLLARREVFYKSKGAYLLFLDADDLLSKTAVQTCGDVIREQHPDILMFDYSYKTDFSDTQKNSGLHYGLFKNQDLKFARSAFCKGESNQLWGKAIRKNLFDFEANYAQYNHFLHGEDLFQMLPIVDKARSILHIASPLYYYRQSDDSGTFHYSPYQLNNIVTLEKRLMDYGKAWELPKESAQGSVLQYCYLLKVLFRDNLLSVHQKRKEFFKISKHIKRCIQNENFSLNGLSLSWKAFIYLASNNHQKLTNFLIALSK